MTSHCFYFLKEKFPEYEEIAKEVEMLTVFEQPKSALTLATNLVEILTIDLSKKNDLEYLTTYKYADILRELFSENIIPIELSTNFENIRKLSEKLDHHSDMLTLDDAYRMHRLLYEVLTWYYHRYGDSKFKPQEYRGPIYKTTIKSDKENRDGNEESTWESKEDIKTDTEVQSQEETEDNPVEENEIIVFGDDMGVEQIPQKIKFEQKDGSYLLYQLSKLSIKSNEAVEGDSNLEPYKDYLHVERSIQNTFIQTLKNIPEDSNHLILLCGSVGDGKSHLLAYLNSHEHDLASQFRIWGDASVSTHSKKDAYEILSELLKPFNDDNLNTTNEKIIVGINLGTLNYFIESNEANNSFKKLRERIEKSNVFDSNNLSQNYFGDFLSIINFSDYNIFELSENSKNEVESDYLSSLIDKIVCQDKKNNPFFKAYELDKNNGLIHPILYNYEMLSSENVKNVIIELIVKISVKYKNFISTRSFLNFIHDILVPPIINQYDNSYSPSDYLEELLPNLLFSKYEDGFMKFLHLEDPTLLRLESLDELIISLNTKENILDVLDNSIDFSNISFLRDFIEYYGSLKDSTTSENTILNTIIRLVYIFQKDNNKNIFYDETYSKYLDYLYFYHKKDNSNYIDLFYEVIEAIFNFQGAIKGSNIIVKNLNHFFLAEKLDITPTVNENDFYLENPNSQKLNRFKTDILLTFNINNNENVPLSLDYSLYEYIIELNKGFKPNKKEEKTLIIFKEFIKEIISKLNSEKVILKDLDNDELFALTYNDFLGKFRWEVESNEF